jgi:hypothetical protein
MGVLPTALAALLTVGSLGATPAAPADVLDYGDPALWICRPDIADDVCDSGLDATAVAPDGTLTAEPFVADPDAPVDCFYVYPTVSFDPAPNSDTDVSAGEEPFTVANQVAPLGTGCRVFAPLYRQVPLAGIGGGFSTEARAVAYADVLGAWHHYLANDNEGRGVVLVGHSQGAGHLARLIADEFDDDAGMRHLLVAAYLAGTSIQVAPGRDVGGDFANVPLCRADDQVGCIVTWSTYRASAPPPDGALFGRDRDGTEAACTNPASLAGGRVELRPRMPSDPRLSIINSPEPAGSAFAATTGTGWLDDGTVVPTPYVTVPGLVTGGCVRWGGYHWLEISVHPDAGPRADDIPGDLSPEWGMHLIDMNVVMGDLQRLLDAQAAAWLAAG